MQIKNGFKSSRRFWACFGLFIIFFVFFQYHNQNYAVPVLALKYNGQSRASVNIYWDSGNGFNNNEHISYMLYEGKNQLADLPLPRERIKSAKIVAEHCDVIKIGSYDWLQNGKIITLPVKKSDGAYIVSDIPVMALDYQLLFWLRLAFAGFLALFCYVIVSRLNTYIRGNFIVALKKLFFCERRLLFGMFSLLFFWWLFWLWCEWPGLLTRDSYYFTIREITRLEFDGIAPVMYNLLVLAFYQIISSPAVISIVQIFCMAWLSARILWNCLRSGAGKTATTLFYLLLVFSIPVATFNLLLVKDIPYSLLTLYFGYLMYSLVLAKRNNTQYFHNNAELILNAILLASLACIRHNGIVFIAAVPVLMFFARLIDIKRWLIFTLSAVLIFGGFIVASRSLQKVSPENINMFFRQSAMIGPVFAAATRGGDVSDAEKQVLSGALPYSEMQKLYTPTPRPENYKNMLINIMKMPPEQFDLFSRTSWNIMKRHPLLVLQDRALMFAGALGLNSNVYIFTDESQTHEGYVYWRPLESYKYDKAAGDFTGVKAWCNAAMLFATSPPQSMWIYNSLPALFLLAAALPFFRKRPATAMYSLIILLNVPVLFAVLSTCEWRMYYYVYLAGFFLIPLWQAEAKSTQNVVE